MNLCSDGCGVTSNSIKQFFSSSDSSDLSINSFLNAPKHTHVSYGCLETIPFQPPDPATFLGPPGDSELHLVKAHSIICVSVHMHC